MNKQVMENATTGQQRQFLLASPPLKWPLIMTNTNTFRKHLQALDGECNDWPTAAIFSGQVAVKVGTGTKSPK